MKWRLAAGFSLAIAVHLLGATPAEFTREGEMDLPSLVTPKPIDAADFRKLPVLLSGPSITVRGKTTVKTNDDDDRQVTPRIAFEVTAAGAARRYEIPIESWLQFCHEVDSDVHAWPIAGGALVSYQESSCGGHASEDTEHLFIIDVNRGEPRVAELDVTQTERWGYASAASYRLVGTTTCKRSARDFECTQSLQTETPWTKVTSTRRFLAFAGTRLPATNEARPLDDLPRVRTERVVIDGVGLVHRIAAVGDAVLYAGVDIDDRLTATFYLAGPHGVTTVPAGDLVDPDPERPERNDSMFTNIDDSITAKTSLLAQSGRTQLWSVQWIAGDQQSLFWIALDPGDREQRFAVLRVASTAPEGQDRNRDIAPSMASYQLVDGGAQVVVVNRWKDDLFTGAPCPDEEEPDIFDGAITWSPDGFEIELTERLDRGEPLQVTISPDGKLATKPREVTPAD